MAVVWMFNFCVEEISLCLVGKIVIALWDGTFLPKEYPHSTIKVTISMQHRYVKKTISQREMESRIDNKVHQEK